MKIDKQEETKIQEDIYEYIEEIKELLSPEIWSNILLDCSKNEIIIFWLLYRKKQATMTEIAQYIHVPLNTATGIVGKMEKKQFVIRDRAKEDKRVVVVELTEKGQLQVNDLVEEMTYYGMQILTEFTKEEMDIFYRMMERVLKVMKQERKKKSEKSKVRRITIE